jgi:cobalamin-dependent methionine synthase I
MGEFPITLVALVTSSNQLGDVFIKGKTYKAKVVGSMLVIKDNLGCLRHFHGEWEKDKLFKEIFEVMKEEEKDG